MTKTAEVSMWGTRVGYVLWDESRAPATGSFEYDPRFCELGIEISPLEMPAIADQVYAYPSLNPAAFKRLPPCLSDSLPDDFGNAVIDAWLARQGRDPNSFSPVERLLYIGRRGMGALEFSPVIAASLEKSEKLQMDKVVELAAEIMAEREKQTGVLNIHTDTADTDTALHHLFQIGTSAGGQRPKAIIALNENTGEICSGQVTAPAGFDYWLLKFDVPQGGVVLGNSTSFGRVEYAYYLMAQTAGIDMMECRLHQEGGRAHFMTRRFDRLGSGEKVHVQTLCAMDAADYTAPGQYSYEQTFQVMREIRLSRTEQIQFYRRMIFNVLGRNQDDHTRNTAFTLRRNGHWQLAPAYDMCWAYRPGSDWVGRHQMTINGKRDDFQRDDLLAVAHQIPHFDPQPILQEVADTIAQWPDFARRAGITDEKLIEAIRHSHRIIR